MSLLGAFIQCAQFGLEPSDGLGECWIIPYGKIATFQLGYKGLVKMLWRTGLLKDFQYEVVYENDVFKVVKGEKTKLIHEPDIDDPGAAKYYYARAVVKASPSI
jgi:recombination protein RecT